MSSPGQVAEERGRSYVKDGDRKLFLARISKDEVEELKKKYPAHAAEYDRICQEIAAKQAARNGPQRPTDGEPAGKPRQGPNRGWFVFHDDKKMYWTKMTEDEKKAVRAANPQFASKYDEVEKEMNEVMASRPKLEPGNPQKTAHGYVVLFNDRKEKWDRLSQKRKTELKEKYPQYKDEYERIDNERAAAKKQTLEAEEGKPVKGRHGGWSVVVDGKKEALNRLPAEKKEELKKKYTQFAAEYETYEKENAAREPRVKDPDGKPYKGRGRRGQLFVNIEGKKRAIHRLEENELADLKAKFPQYAAEYDAARKPAEKEDAPEGKPFKGRRGGWIVIDNGKRESLNRLPAEKREELKKKYAQYAAEYDRFEETKKKPAEKKEQPEGKPVKGRGGWFVVVDGKKEALNRLSAEKKEELKKKYTQFAAEYETYEKENAAREPRVKDPDGKPYKGGGRRGMMFVNIEGKKRAIHRLEENELADLKAKFPQYAAEYDAARKEKQNA